MSKHKEMFKQEEAARTVSYVAFNASPSAEDTAKVFNQVNNLKS